MRCYCCNKALSDYEATRKSVTTGNFLDMCNKCYGSVSSEILSLERTDLRHEDQDEDEVFQDVGKDDYFTMWNDKPLEDN
jgi:hypothetical protein